MAVLPPFSPFPFLGRPHLQTVVASRLAFGRGPPSLRKEVALRDGDRLVLEVSTPPAWAAPERTVVMVHGLCGSSRSSYLVRLARKLYRLGMRAARVNLRGCGEGRGLARQPYHSGRSEDIVEVLRSLREETPASPLALVGFSLGGNIALKLAGELGEEGRGLLEQVIAVCPPVDLVASSRRFDLPANHLYQGYFVGLLRRTAAERLRDFPGCRRVDLPRRLTLRDFDELYTAVECGFEGAMDYYRRASALPLLSRIAVPTRILIARDDPLIDSSTLEALEMPPPVELHRTERGGHLGFLGCPGTPGGFWWMDSLLLAWIGGGSAPASSACGQGAPGVPATGAAEAGR